MAKRNPPEILSVDEAYARDMPRRPKSHPPVPCKGRAGRERGWLDAAELKREFREKPVPDAKVGPKLQVRHAPCVRPHRPDFGPGLDLLLQVIPPAILMRGELTMETMWPWCTIGKVFVGKDDDFANPMTAGSAVLVGPNLLLTASHVAPWGYDPWWMRFVPAYRQGDAPFGQSYVESYRGIRNTDDVTGRDYVTCKLYDRLGDTTGWMGSWGSSGDDFYYDGEWISVGYPGDSFGGHVPMVELGIKIDDVDDEGSDGKELEAYPFASPGWSGGPLWGWVHDQARVVGIMSGEETEFSFWDFFTVDYHVSAGGLRMVDLVKYGWANWT